MRIWVFNPPTDALSLKALQEAGVSTVVTSRIKDIPPKPPFTTYAMIHVFPTTGSPEDLAMDIHGQPVEWFSSGCPNSPAIRSAFYAEMERLLAQPIRGIFLDGIRFSSPASSTIKTSFLTCFCPRCQRDMAKHGYDAEKIRQDINTAMELLSSPGTKRSWLRALYSPSGWFSLMAAYPGILDWLQYRAECVTIFVKELRAWMKEHSPDKKLAAFLFQPCLSYLVGQNYLALAPHLDIVSPMIYRNYPHQPGPATINQEMMTMADFLEEAGIPFGQGFKDLLAIFGLEIDGSFPNSIEDSAGISIPHVIGEVKAARAMAGSQGKVAPIIWAGDPQLEETLRQLENISLQSCILFTYEAGFTAHKDQFLDILGR